VYLCLHLFAVIIVDLVFTIIHLIPFFLQAFVIRSAVVFSFGSFESATVTIAICHRFIFTIYICFCNKLFKLRYLHYQYYPWLIPSFFPILYFADKFHSFFSLKGNTLICDNGALSSDFDLSTISIKFQSCNKIEIVFRL
jgi:hypothetical protein